MFGYLDPLGIFRVCEQDHMVVCQNWWTSIKGPVLQQLRLRAIPVSHLQAPNTSASFGG